MRLKELRKQRKLNQQAVADVLNCSQAVYSRYESGDREPPLETLIRLADYYQVSLDELVGRVPMDVVANENPPTAYPQEGMVRIVIPADVEPEPDDLERRIHEIVMKEFEKRGL